jgi:hypothetical protein
MAYMDIYIIYIYGYGYKYIYIWHIMGYYGIPNQPMGFLVNKTSAKLKRDEKA